MYNSFQQKIALINSYLLIALIFFVPISTSLSGLFAILIILLWFVEGNLMGKFRELIQNKLVIAVLAYVGLFALGLLWTDDLSWGLTQTKKQWKLLLFLPLLTITRREHYKYYITSFLAAMTLSAFLSFLLWQELIHFKGVTPQFPIPFNSHISYNPLLALALYLLYHLIIFAPRPPAKQLALVVPAALIMTGSMFITTGRTGQAAFFVLIILLTLQYFRKRIAFGLVAILIMLPVLLITAYNTGPGFRMRVNDTVANLKEYRSKPDKSIPLRLTFAANSLRMAADSIWFGVGTGDFPNEYKKINAAHSPSFKYTDDPHNHYLLVLTQFGVFGLLVFLSIFFIQIRQAFSNNNGLHHFRVALPVFYLTIMAAGTYLLGHELSLCFAITSSILNKNERSYNREKAQT